MKEKQGKFPIHCICKFNLEKICTTLSFDRLIYETSSRVLAVIVRQGVNKNSVCHLATVRESICAPTYETANPVADAKEQFILI